MNSLKIVKKSGNYDLYLTFFSQKVEKIVSAIYLVTSYFPSEESLRWQLRDRGLHLLSHTLSLRDINLSYKDKTVSEIKDLILEIVSFLDISFIAKIITEMNADILKRELNLLLNIIERGFKEIRQNDSQFLEHNFFKVKGESLSLETNVIKDDKLDKRHYKGQTKLSFNLLNNVVKKEKINYSIKKKTRKDEIIKLFNKGQKLTIKDISQVIDNCGEKTIQRELQFLMKEGKIKKEGERRWSQYSLN